MKYFLDGKEISLWQLKQELENASKDSDDDGYYTIELDIVTDNSLYFLKEHITWEDT